LDGYHLRVGYDDTETDGISLAVESTLAITIFLFLANLSANSLYIGASYLQ